MIHHLKTWPQYFESIAMKEKQFEVRENDRCFQAGDVLKLQEYDPSTSSYTGRCIQARVTYVLCGPGFGIQDGYCVMSIDNIILQY